MSPILVIFICITKGWSVIDNYYGKYPQLKNYFTDFVIANKDAFGKKDVEGILGSLLLSRESVDDLYYPFYALVMMAKEGEDYDSVKPRITEVAKMIDAKGDGHNLLQLVDPALARKYEEKEEKATRVQDGGQCPEFTYKDVDGKEYHLKDFAGKMIVFDF